MVLGLLLLQKLIVSICTNSYLSGEVEKSSTDTAYIFDAVQLFTFKGTFKIRYISVIHHKNTNNY